MKSTKSNVENTKPYDSNVLRLLLTCFHKRKKGNFLRTKIGRNSPDVPRAYVNRDRSELDMYADMKPSAVSIRTLEQVLLPLWAHPRTPDCPVHKRDIDIVQCL